MALSDAARVARHDQARAAQEEVLGILDDLVRDRQHWRRIDGHTQQAIEVMVARLLAIDDGSDRVCPHARRGAFDTSPRPLVLDAVHGILACWEGCYWTRVPTGVQARTRITTHCFDCGRSLVLRSGRDIIVAYGPILVVAALCPHCRGTSQPGPAGGSDR